MYLNCTTGNLLIKDPTTIEHYFKIPETKKRPIMCHAEIDILPTVLLLSAKYKQRTHICHIARKSEMKLVAIAKQTNKLLTCEVSPHHLLLTKQLSQPNPLFNVKPNLQTPTDIATLWKHLPSTIDCIATDHAPHLYKEKETLGSFGFTGIETLLPIMLQQVKEGRLTLERLVELTYTNPLKLLPASPTIHPTLTIKNPYHPETETVKYKKNVHSKSKWSPFIGHLVIKDPIIKYNSK